MKTKEKILITGGCGFIGHHLALALKKAGKEVVIFDALEYEYKHPLYRMFIEMRLKRLKRARIPILRGNLTVPKEFDQAFEAVRPDRVVHLAAIVSAAECNARPKEGYEVNLHSTQILLETLRRRGLPRQLVFSSTSMVYGHFDGRSVNEESPVNPIGIYEVSKLASEHMIKAYHNIFGLPYTIVRPSALYGPTCINRRVSQIFIEGALTGKTMFLEGKGETSLDFTYIDDLTDGLTLVLTKEAALNQTFNMTYGRSRKIKQLAALIEQRFPEVRFADRPWDESVPRRGTLDISKARRMLGYSPRFPLEKGYPMYIDWYQRIDFGKNREEFADIPLRSSSLAEGHWR